MSKAVPMAPLYVSNMQITPTHLERLCGINRLKVWKQDQCGRKLKIIVCSRFPGSRKNKFDQRCIIWRSREQNKNTRNRCLYVEGYWSWHADRFSISSSPIKLLLHVRTELRAHTSGPCNRLELQRRKKLLLLAQYYKQLYAHPIYK
jgi:hypothetical protein